MDFHCDGKVNYSEFLAATISTINFNKEEKLWSAFKYFDTTDSGYITLDSVMDALKDSRVIIDEEGLKKTFIELQKKGKKINFNEFKAIALGQDIIEEDHEIEYSSKENEKETNNKINLKFNYKKNIPEVVKEDTIRKMETVFIKEEKKESQDIFFEKLNFSTNNNNLDKEISNKKNGRNKENNNKNEKSEKKERNTGIDNINENKNNIKINHNKGSKSNIKSSKSNNKSSKSNNISNKSYNKSFKSNNKTSKSNIDILIEEHSIDNNDRFTEVNEIQD